MNAMHRRTLAALVILGLIGTACGSDPEVVDTSPPQGETGPDPATFAAEVASIDLWAGDPQHVQIGVFSATETAGIQLVTGGTLQITFGPFGEEAPGSAVEARYLPAPGTAGDASSPLGLTSPDTARGVYQADDVVFDEAGIWQADVAFEVDGTPVALRTQFEVLEEPHLPAPGQPALASDSLTMQDAGADPAAIDSRAVEGGRVPDPELHGLSIEDAIGSGSPTLVLFATPVYCQSQFCGPDVEWLEDLAAERPKDATYLHVEIWQDYQAQALNEAAAEWLYRDDELTEPWLFLIDAEGTIAERWGPLFDPTDVEAALDRASA
jgi:hypothetical protein